RTKRNANVVVMPIKWTLLRHLASSVIVRNRPTFADDPSADLGCDRAVGKSLDERARGKQAALGMAPSQQGLRTDDASIGEPDLRLKEGMQLGFRQCSAQLRVGRAPALARPAENDGKCALRRTLPGTARDRRSRSDRRC